MFYWKEREEGIMSVVSHGPLFDQKQEVLNKQLAFWTNYAKLYSDDDKSGSDILIYL